MIANVVSNTIETKKPILNEQAFFRYITGIIYVDVWLASGYRCVYGCLQDFQNKS
jgi:hypothetical protein